MSKLFSIFDSKVAAYALPFTAPTELAAIRMVVNAASDEDSDLHKFGADYTLFGIADFDEHTGTITPHEHHGNLGTALEILADQAACLKSQKRRALYALKKEATNE